MTVLFALMAIIPSISAQQLTPMPLNPKVKSGVLPNGLSYYILHNEEPKGRANFYIAQKVGSTLETEEQLGLAHFLEHMAFNGTSTYPGKSMLNYLQSKGIRFGADINAYTMFDETVYNINNVPTADSALMDSVLLVLRDWSGSILLEETEIDAERGVIQEEWRQRNDAQTRMYTSILPQLFEEYQYQQMPIGKMEVVMNFKPEAIRSYYKKWYRPDLQGIILVGDFDASLMEEKVKNIFASIPMPENAAERAYPSVSDNKEPIYVTFEDPELQNDMIQVAFKYDKTPFEYRNTVESYVQDYLMKDVLAKLINNRLSEHMQSADCKYAYSFLHFGNYFVADTKGATTIIIIPRGDDTEAAFKDAMSIIARACQTGFTDSELERVNTELLANYEKSYNEKDKTDSDALATELIRHFIENEPTPGIENEYEIVKQMLPMFPVQAYNEFAKSLLTPENQVVVVAQHQSEGRHVPSKETIIGALNEVLNTQYEAYVDEVITDPLIAKLPSPGKIKSKKENNEFGTTEFVLSNGVRVFVKPTDFSNDEIILTAYMNGGKQAYAPSMATDVLMLDDAFEASKIGPFDVNQMKKYLTGKKVGIGYSVNMMTTQLNGMSTVKDLQTMFEILYAIFTDLNPDKDQWNTLVQRYSSILANQESNPMVVFQKAISKNLWNNNPIMEKVGLKQLTTADYDTMYGLIKESLKNAADYTIVLTGNVNVATLEPLLMQYVATLPSAGKPSKTVIKNPIAIPAGVKTDEFTQVMQIPTVIVFDAISGDKQYTAYNDICVSLLSDVLGIIYTNTLREEEGGTYGAAVNGQMLPASEQWTLQYNFQTGPEMEARLRERAWVELNNLLKSGTDAETFNKVKGAAIAQYDIQSKTNQFWDTQLVLIDRGYNIISGYRDALEKLTLEDFNKFISELYNGQNRITVVMESASAE